MVDLEYLLTALDDRRYQELAPLLADVGEEERRAILFRLAEESPHSGDDVQRRAFVQTLIDAGADVHAVGIFGETALHVAAYWRNVSLMRVLMDNGADVDARTKKVWFYNDGKLRKGISPRDILDDEIRDALEHNRIAELQPHVLGAASLLFGIAFDQWVAQVRTSTVQPKPAQNSRSAAVARSRAGTRSRGSRPAR